MPRTRIASILPSSRSANITVASPVASIVTRGRRSAFRLVVGSGVAGSLVAYELAKAHVPVLMLEAGPRLERWRIVEAFRNSPAKRDFQSPYPPNAHAPHPQYSPPNNYLIQKARTHTSSATSVPWLALPGIGM